MRVMIHSALVAVREGTIQGPPGAKMESPLNIARIEASMSADGWSLSRAGRRSRTQPAAATQPVCRRSERKFRRRAGLCPGISSTAAPRQPFPVLLWHGGRLTGAIWETCPDGRPGWLTHLLRAGFDVYVADAAGMGRSSSAHRQDLSKSAPLLRSEARGGIVSADLRALRHAAGTTDAVRRHAVSARAVRPLRKGIMPRWRGAEMATCEAYCELVREAGPCAIIAHESSAAFFAYEAARRCPELVRAVASLSRACRQRGLSKRA